MKPGEAAERHTPKPLNVRFVPKDQQGLAFAQNAAQAQDSFLFVLSIHLVYAAYVQKDFNARAPHEER